MTTDRWDAGVQVALAKSIATLAHQGQTDKLGAAYITHPARVASRFDGDLEPLEHCAAWLHDVIEDSGYTADDLLAAGVHRDVVDAVILLTRDTATPPEEYYRRIAADRVALAVKAADIDDNLSPVRTALLDSGTRERLAIRYDNARRSLGLAPRKDTD